MTAEPKVEFDRERASQYDLDIRRAIPGYEALHDMTVSCLQTSLPKTARVLVVGSGTGKELVDLSEKFPQWLLTGVEPSAAMMAIAKQKLSDRKIEHQINLHIGYLDSLPREEPMDAATLILVMHFLPDDGSKLRLLQNIARHLKLGAEIVIADLHGDRSTHSFNRQMQAWKSYYFKRLDAITRAKAELEFEPSIQNSIYFVSEARMIELLSSAGFEQIAKFYNAFLFGGWIAKYVGT